MNTQVYFKQKHLVYRSIVLFVMVCLFVCIPGICEIILGGDSLIKGGDTMNLSRYKKITLEEAIHSAIERNPLLQSTRDQVDAASGMVKQSRLYPNPILEFMAEEVPTNEIGLNQSQNLVAIIQPIITGGKRGLGIKVSEKSKEKDVLERDAVLLSVISETKKSFYKAIADQESFGIAQKIENIAEGIYESEKIRYEAGEVAVTNVLRAEVELSKARNSVIHAKGNLNNAIRELQTVMGIPEGVIDCVIGRLFSRPVELSLSELERKMKNNQPFLKASKKNIEIAETVLMLEKRHVIPDLNVSAGYKRLSSENIDTVQFGILIQAPFLNRNQGNIQKSKALSRKAKNENLSVYNELLFQLKKNFNSYNVERQRAIEFKDKILPNAEESLTLITKGYKEGEFDYMNLLDVQRTWAETRIAYIESLKNLNLIIADIERLAVTKIGEQ